MSDTHYITPEQAATLKGVTPVTVRRILRNKVEQPLTFPGAIRIGSPRRGVWLIPLEDVKQWTPRPRGRPPG